MEYLNPFPLVTKDLVSPKLIGGDTAMKSYFDDLMEYLNPFSLLTEDYASVEKLIGDTLKKLILMVIKWSTLLCHE